jgi:hypothetical protein
MNREKVEKNVTANPNKEKRKAKFEEKSSLQTS